MYSWKTKKKISGGISTIKKKTAQRTAVSVRCAGDGGPAAPTAHTLDP